MKIEFASDNKKLGQVQQDYLVDVIMTWIQKEIERQEHKI